MSNLGKRVLASGLASYFSVLLGLLVGLQIVAVGQQGAVPVDRQEMVVVREQASKPNKAQLTSLNAHALYLKGRKLTSAEAKNLESTLAAEPTDLATRLTLIAYYTTGYDEIFKLKKSEHLLWVIRNVPDSEIFEAFPSVGLMPGDKEFKEAKALWLTQLDTYEGNLIVLSSAAKFFLLTDKPLAMQLTRQGAAADPTNPKWPAQLGQLYSLQMPRATVEARRSLAANAYPQYELAYKLTSSNVEKLMLLAPLATSAFEAGELEKAKSWALQALSDAAAAKTAWSTGGSVHHAHITLGRVALLSGNLGEAKQHLIAAGQGNVSPSMGSFGPNMMLAKELLEKGERDSVIQYFEECATFWKMSGDKINQWTAIVKDGKIPDFGANLVY